MRESPIPRLPSVTFKASEAQLARYRRAAAVMFRSERNLSAFLRTAADELAERTLAHRRPRQ